jgi:putative ABC transport system permease protein
VREAVSIALRGLRANRLRSVLTMLGIVIGVAAVIVLVALGNGTSAKLNAQIESLGTNLIGILQTRGSVSASGRSQPLTDKDVDALRESGDPPQVLSVTPIKQASAVLEYETGNYRTNITGSSQDYPRALNRHMASGSFFTDADVNTSSRVVVLGQIPVNKLFGGYRDFAVDQKVRIGRQSFRVVGVLAENGQADDLAVMPVTAARNYLVGGDDSVDQIVVEANGQAAVPATMAKLNRVLSERHHIGRADQKDFEIHSNMDLLAKYTEFSSMFTVFLAVIAAIALFVGGIGVMNIMLVTVTERTREIGIRMAIGARRRSILVQFLVEAVVLAGLGGVIGAGLGVGLTLLAGNLGTTVADFAPPLLSIPSVVLAFSVSLAIGLFFGAYPANRASRMRPIDALRYE